MDSFPDARVDPGELARLVLSLRELRARVDEVLDDLPARDETPFLYRQLDDHVDALIERFDLLKAGESKGRKKKLLGRMFGKGKGIERARHPDLEGNSWTIPVSELINFLANAQKTGILWVDTEYENFVIEIKHGNLMRATSDSTPEGMRLGELLVESKTLRSKSEVKTSVQQAKKYGLSLGSYLIESGRATEEEIQEALEKQVQGLFFRLLKAGNAIYRFQEGVKIENAKELYLNVTSLLLEGARRHDEEDATAALSKALDFDEDEEAA